MAAYFISKHSKLIFIFLSLAICMKLWYGKTEISYFMRKDSNQESSSGKSYGSPFALSAMLSTSTMESGSQDTKLILNWETYSGLYQWTGIKACGGNDCEFTDDKSRVEEATVVIFGSAAVFELSYNWPDVRFSNQSYVFLMGERPHTRQLWLLRLNGKINWTLNYRTDTDISLKPLFVANKSSYNPVPYIPSITLNRRSGSVFWAVSHCQAESGRDEYAHELSKYINVDIYGKCGNFTCIKRGETDCMDEIASKYKFYLSFENMICQDYVTEKLRRPLESDIIPIVFGGADYSKIAPPGSVINILDYKNPAQLARHLHYLANNETAFNSYFQWKTKFQYVGHPDETQDECLLCKAAHDPTMARPAHENLFSWWFGACDNGLMGRMRKAGNW